MAETIESKVLRVETIAALGHLAKAREVMGQIDLEEPRANAMAALVPWLAKWGHAEEALEIARGIRWPNEYCVKALAALGQEEEALGRVEEALGHVKEALELAQRIGDECDRSQTKSKLGAGTTQTSPSSPDEWDRSQTKSELGHRAEASEVAQEIGFEADRSQAKSDPGRVTKELEQLRGITFKWSDVKELLALMPHPAAPEHLQQALELARGIGDDGDRARTLAALVPRLGESGHVQEALVVVREIGQGWARAGIVGAGALTWRRGI